jgi:hypothetical protein
MRTLLNKFSTEKHETVQGTSLANLERMSHISSHSRGEERMLQRTLEWNRSLRIGDGEEDDMITKYPWISRR